MSKRWRFLFVPVAVISLMVLALPGAADHQTRSDVKNLTPIAETTNTDTLANSDMAFWGDMAIQGMWEGFLIHDISNPANPSTIVDYANPVRWESDRVFLAAWVALLLSSVVASWMTRRRRGPSSHTGGP